MGLVDQGMLALDEPLNGYLSEPYLPQEEYRLKSSSPMCAISQRHLKSGKSSPSTVRDQTQVITLADQHEKRKLGENHE
jgi:hypothetical protein